jgi:hypothetical protein
MDLPIGAVEAEPRVGRMNELHEWKLFRPVGIVSRAVEQDCNQIVFQAAVEYSWLDEALGGPQGSGPLNRTDHSRSVTAVRSFLGRAAATGTGAAVLPWGCVTHVVRELRETASPSAPPDSVFKSEEVRVGDARRSSHG